MEIHLHITNLNNSIRFYNRLFGKPPASLKYTSAYYPRVMNGMDVRLAEAENVKPDQLKLYVSEEEKYLQIFRQMKIYSAGKGATTCKVLENAFVLLDPDGNTWTITKSLDLDSKVDPDICFLEPFRNN